MGVAHWSRLGLELASEELAQVAVLVQVLHGCLLHVDPKGPDVEAVDGLAEPGWQVNLVQPTPGPREEPRGDGFIEGDLHRRNMQSVPKRCDKE